jgi:hypothetical protein
MAKRKRTNNDVQNITQKTKDRATRIPLKAYVSQRLSILCSVFFIITLFVRLYVRVGILLSCGKHLHDRILSLRGGP